ncbi:receptor-like protein 35 [Tripterygium wilfordii]|uniref:receptor-like protein 35 n=1 Tax=Tripterygium wilfordii TaxID=458696 RepID=UPI0018F80354|nr:receptor-like protein 35 [Tripterygium wilfordii]
MGQYSRILYFLFLFLSLEFCSSSSFSSFSTNTSLQLCSHYDKLALIEFKSNFSLNINVSSDCPTSYPKTNSWKEGRDCCSWDGVTCDTVTGRVIGLDLSCSWLYGSLRSNNSLFRLKHLQKLNLAHNYFNSRISSKFGKFESLTNLNLSYSGFSGQVPSAFSYLSKLISLHISGFTVEIEVATLRGFLQNATVLQELFFDEVDMSSVNPGLLTNLSSSLTSLHIDSCYNLHGKIPENILLLPNLQLLHLTGDYRFYFDDIDDIDSTFYLTEGLVGDYGLSIDFRMSNWSTPLRHLVLVWIYSPREFPESICNLTSLEFFDFSYNNISKSQIPTCIGSLTHLIHLRMFDNNLYGRIPSSLSNLTKLDFLSLSRNQLVGPAPDLSKSFKTSFLGLILQLT